jgi:hypothetical protein
MYKYNKAWRMAHPDKRRKESARYYAKHAINKKRKGFAWTTEEDKLVIEHSMPDTALSKIIERSVKAIQIRRCRLNK